MSEQDERAAIVAEARTWLGTQYHHMGRVKGAGTDCGMLICEVFERVGLVDHQEIPYYPFDIAMHSEKTGYLDYIKAHSKQVDREPLPGDVIVYKFPGAKVPHHASIVITDELIIHSYINKGVILSERRGYRRYEIGVFSFWGG